MGEEATTSSRELIRLWWDGHGAVVRTVALVVLVIVAAAVVYGAWSVVRAITDYLQTNVGGPAMVHLGTSPAQG